MVKLSSIFLIGTLIAASQIVLSFQKLSKDRVVLAINCGGEEYVDSNGIKYIEDKYFSKGQTSDFGLNYDISDTNDMELYQTERWFSDTFSYSLPLSADGVYTLILKFSEVYFQSSGQKVFDVALGKKVVLKRLDIFDKVGKAAALDEPITFELKKGFVYIKGEKLQGAYDSKEKTLSVRFVKGSADNPKINAILLFKGDLEGTEYAEKKKKIQEKEREKLRETRKKYAITLRHDSDEIFDEEALLNNDIDDLYQKKDSSLFSIFYTVPGACIGLSFFLFLMLVNLL